MSINLKKQYEDKYNSMTDGDRSLVDYILYFALGWGRAHICSSCLQKYLVLPDGINLFHKRLIISDDYFVRKHVGEEATCEMRTCSNQADYNILADV